MAARRDDIDDTDVWYKYEALRWTLQEIANQYGVSRTTIYYRLHPEKQKEINQSEIVKERKKIYCQSDKGKAAIKRYCQSEKGKERGNNRSIRFLQSEKGKAWMIKHNAERRELGSIELNKPFPDSEFHHYDKEHGIHIPPEIHRSIPHNLKTGQGMEAINKEAFEFLEWEKREMEWEGVEEREMRVL